MEWIRAVNEALQYMEEHLCDDITAADAGEHVYLSSYYFHKCFTMLCGYRPGEYIRNRRLSEAAKDLLNTDISILDLALKYRYDSPDSFTKAFTRFHGCTPSDVRRNRGTVRSFAPLHIKVTVEGGSMMNYRIEEKEAFKVMGVSEQFDVNTSFTDIPKYWDKVQEKKIPVDGTYGICISNASGSQYFRYMIADDYEEERAQELEVYEIPAGTWLVTACTGPIPETIQNTTRKVYSELLPTLSYEPADTYDIEYYSDPAEYKQGIKDPEYYTEVWIPLKQ